MLRRFSPFQLVFALVVVVLWGVLLWSRDARELAFRYGRVALAPRSFDYSLPFEPTERVELQMIDASEGRDLKKLRALVEANPRDATLLAVYVRNSHMLPTLYKYQAGPLVGLSSRNWSVQIANIEPPVKSTAGFSTKITTASVGGPFRLMTQKQFLDLVERGQKLEPQNNYWDWMEMTALVEAGRELELDAIVHRAARKPIFDDHGAEELRARIAYFERKSFRFEPSNKVSAFSGQLLPHASAISGTCRFFAQRVMGLRLQKRDAEALRLGMDAIRLVRQIRLQTNIPILSESAKRSEFMIIEKAGLPLGQRRPAVLGQSLLNALATDPNSLLFLARAKSPKAASEIATEWQRLNRWVIVSPSLFGVLVEPSTMMDVGSVTRAASFFAASLPITLSLWFLFFLVGRIEQYPTRSTSPRLVWWGASLGLLLLGLFFLLDWSGGRGSPEPEEWMSVFSSSLEVSRVAWGGMALSLVWIALWFRPQLRTLDSRSKRRIEDWEMSHVETMPFRVMDWAWNTLKWGTPFVTGMLCIGGASFTLLCWPDDRGQKPLWSVEHVFFLGVVLVVLPAMWVGLREAWYWKQTKQRLGAPQIFVARTQLLLGGYLRVALVALPICIWAQSRLESDFNRHFAPIEKGQMVRAIQRMRGVPMQ